MTVAIMDTHRTSSGRVQEVSKVTLGCCGASFVSSRTLAPKLAVLIKSVHKCADV